MLCAVQLRYKEKLSCMHQGSRAAERVRKMRKTEAGACVKIESLEVRAKLAGGNRGA